MYIYQTVGRSSLPHVIDLMIPHICSVVKEQVRVFFEDKYKRWLLSRVESGAGNDRNRGNQFVGLQHTIAVFCYLLNTLWTVSTTRLLSWRQRAMNWFASLFSPTRNQSVRRGQAMSTTHEAFSLPTSTPGHGRHPDAFNPASLRTPDSLNSAYTYPPQSPVSSYKYAPTSYVHSHPNAVGLH